jgi:hypothetical protein
LREAQNNFGGFQRNRFIVGLMKPMPPPEIPGNTEFERFDNALRQVLTVPKETDQHEEQPKAQQKKPPRPKKE